MRVCIASFPTESYERASEARREKKRARQKRETAAAVVRAQGLSLSRGELRVNVRELGQRAPTSTAAARGCVCRCARTSERERAIRGECIRALFLSVSRCCCCCCCDRRSRASPHSSSVTNGRAHFRRSAPASVNSCIYIYTYIRRVVLHEICDKSYYIYIQHTVCV